MSFILENKQKCTWFIVNLSTNTLPKFFNWKKVFNIFLYAHSGTIKANSGSSSWSYEGSLVSSEAHTEAVEAQSTWTWRSTLDWSCNVKTLICHHRIHSFFYTVTKKNETSNNILYWLSLTSDLSIPSCLNLPGPLKLYCIYSGLASHTLPLPPPPSSKFFRGAVVIVWWPFATFRT